MQHDELVAAAALDQSSLWISSFVDGYAADLKVIAGSSALKTVSGGPDGPPRLAGNFTAWIASKRDIVQLRYIDAAGDEIVRIDRSGSDIIATAPDGLQNKIGRYYVSAALQLPAGSIYVSPLDLNIEHGAIEVPWRPMLRLAMPVNFIDGAPSGIIVINLDAGRIIGGLNRFLASPLSEIALLNADGYWLAGAPEEDLWGFMFNRDDRLATEKPALWASMTSQGDGTFFSAGQYAVFRRLAPSDNAVGVNTADHQSWYLLTTYAEPTGIWSLQMWPRFLLIIIGSFVSAAFVARLISASQRADAQVRKAELQLAQSARLASLGGLVAGVAHELNTPIGNALTISTTITDHVGALSAETASGRIGRNRIESLISEISDGTDLMQKALVRAADIIRNFKQVAVDQTSERRRRFVLDSYLIDTLHLLSPLFNGRSVSLRYDQLEPLPIDGYPGPLAQVISNLVENALIHGFGAEGTGTITIKARKSSQKTAEITVSDNGKGMTAEVLARSLEPFFTTSPQAGGSGLGLSIVHTIVTEVLGGSLEISSQEGRGTSVTVSIPLVMPLSPTPDTVEEDRHETR
ncbi:HAMP domain-containing sensor histidine kinase [Martelella sp. HB161492]|uniref:sensor histidine kinase n=1 Tax=Martelella sp. HB161492 TaxID=2720726 RepID=UPI001591C76A|nr:HAMP domain-containing sensor histidine kinase [Martelella sp. HB161492]